VLFRSVAEPDGTLRPAAVSAQNEAESTPISLAGCDTRGAHNTRPRLLAEPPADRAPNGRPAADGSGPLAGYQLLEPLGRGGFGEVWKAIAPGGFQVALKYIPLGDEAGDIELRALEVMKGIRHAHLLPMFGAWQVEGQLVIAMELAECTLMQRLEQARAEGLPGIPGEELHEYLREAAKGLDYLNDYRPDGVAGPSAGVLHRDVKPQNLLLVGGTVKVADFGLARVLEHTAMSASGSLTPAYSAPEFLSGQATRWSDQYCLAVTYCHLRGGQLPFTGNAAKVMAGHLLEAPDLTMLPEAERPAVARALAKKPAERWPSCRAFAAALTAAAEKDTAGEAAEPMPPSASGRRGSKRTAVAVPRVYHRPFRQELAPTQGWFAWLMVAIAAALIGWLLVSGRLGGLINPIVERVSTLMGHQHTPTAWPDRWAQP